MPEWLAITGVLLVLGAVGLFVLFVVLLTKIIRGVGWLLAALLGLNRSRPRRGSHRIVSDTRRSPCPRPNCGYWNAPHAKFCAMCGRPMGPQPVEVDAYG